MPAALNSNRFEPLSAHADSECNIQANEITFLPHEGLATVKCLSLLSGSSQERAAILKRKCKAGALMLVLPALTDVCNGPCRPRLEPSDQGGGLPKGGQAAARGQLCAVREAGGGEQHGQWRGLAACGAAGSPETKHAVAPVHLQERCACAVRATLAPAAHRCCFDSMSAH